jgi:1-acyl-sn-glycerol-3-phosphate acyltransferase
MCFCVGLSLREVRLEGAAQVGRPVVYIANHSSWLDILVLGALLPAAFVSKGEVRAWPGIGLIARLGRTVFVERRSSGAAPAPHASGTRCASGWLAATT